MKKKMIALLMAGVMAVGMLAGCGSTNRSSQSESSTKQSSAESETKSTVVESSTEEVKEEPVTVTWWMYGGAADEHDLVMEELNKLLVEKINVKLDLVMIASSEFDEKVRLASMAGEDFDLVWTSNWKNHFDANVSRDAFMAIEDIVAEYGQEMVASMPDGLLDVGKVDGHLYAIPNQQILARQLGVYVQKEYAEKYNLTLTHIDDISEMYDFFDQIVANEPDVWPLLGTKGMTLSIETEKIYESLANGYVFIKKDDDNLTAVPEVIAREELFRTQNEWYKRGYVQPDFATVTDTTANAKAGKYICHLATYKPGGAEEVSNQQGREYIVIPAGEPYLQATSGQETMTAVNVNSKNPEAAVKLLNLVYTDKEVFNMLLSGIEGVHYNKIDDTHIQTVENCKYNYAGNAWKFGNQFLAYYNPQQIDGTWEETDKMNRESEVSPIRGFAFDSTNVQAELAQLDAVSAEFSKGQYIAEDIDAWMKERADKLEKAGLSKVVAEVQAQLDAWKASK
ncbi:MAG: extracellular solute-binding protein [Lachnospiraceae bacterium]|nr:extracellular solute-binding protein [Lachnospiraceae bacterium]